MVCLIDLVCSSNDDYALAGENFKATDESKHSSAAACAYGPR